jgi:hypothetical protein
MRKWLRDPPENILVSIGEAQKNGELCDACGAELKALRVLGQRYLCGDCVERKSRNIKDLSA